METEREQITETTKIHLSFVNETRNSTDNFHEPITNTTSLYLHYTDESWYDSPYWQHFEENALEISSLFYRFCIPGILLWGVLSNALVIVSLVERNISPQHLSLIFLAGENTTVQ